MMMVVVVQGEWFSIAESSGYYSESFQDFSLRPTVSWNHLALRLSLSWAEQPVCGTTQTMTLQTIPVTPSYN